MSDSVRKGRGGRFVESGVGVTVRRKKPAVEASRTLSSRSVTVTVPQRFHAGPGPHPGTGSPQAVHGGKGGGGGWSPSFTESVTNRQTRAQVTAGMGRVAARYPSLVQGVTVGVTPEWYAAQNPGVLMATPKGQDKRIDVSSRWTDDPQKAAEMNADALDRKVLAATPRGIDPFERSAVHEMAHIAEHRVGDAKMLAAVDAAMLRDHGITASALVAGAQANPVLPLSRDLYFNWSHYAMESTGEFIAESFADGMLNSTPSPYGATVLGVFDSLFGSAPAPTPSGGQQ
jgi:hypothetical protein